MNVCLFVCFFVCLCSILVMQQCIILLLSSCTSLSLFVTEQESVREVWLDLNACVVKNSSTKRVILYLRYTQCNYSCFVYYLHALLAIPCILIVLYQIKFFCPYIPLLGVTFLPRLCFSNNDIKRTLV